MDPLTIAALGTTALSTIFGMGEQSKQRKLQKQMMDNQMQIAREQQQLAEEMAKRGIATQIDANGNVTAYNQATNTWQTILSPTQQRIQDLSDQEQINQLTTDAPMGRIENILNATRRSREGVAADGALASLTDTLANPIRGGDLASQLRLDRTRAVNQGFDNVSSALTTQALRSGATGGSALLDQLARQRSQAIASTMGSPDIEGLQLASQLNSNNAQNGLNIYNVLASRASGAPIQTFNPTSVGANANAALSGSRNAAAGALNSQAGALNSAAGIYGNTTLPDYTKGGLSDVFASISNLLGSGAMSDIFGPKTPAPVPKDKSTDWTNSGGKNKG